MPKTFELSKDMYYYVQRCIVSSNNSNLDAKSYLSTQIVLSNQHQESHHYLKTTKLGKSRMENSKN